MAEIKQKPFLKLSQTKQFTVQKYLGRKYKKWDVENKKMLESQTWQQGFRLMYKFEVIDGIIELSKSQVGDMCSSILNQSGTANLINKTFLVKTNGKSGMDIRYFLNPILSKDEIVNIAEDFNGEIQY